MSAPRLVLAVGFSVSVLLGCVATGAGAYATIAPPPSASPSSGLPDGRVYELVSPFNKHGFEVGPGVFLAESGPGFSISSPNGNAVAFESKGPAAETDSSGLSANFVAERQPDGWKSRSVTARGLGQNERISVFVQSPHWRDYTPDLSHLAYALKGAQVAGQPSNSSATGFYLLGSEPLAEPTWLLRDALPNNELDVASEIVGISPDASIVYIAGEARLLPQDASRLGWGLYEYRNGVLSEAGVLPSGNVPGSGAVPLGTSTELTKPHQGTRRPGENNPASLDNQVSEDGRRVFFQSSGQLYVHKIETDGSERSVLVSASQLPGHVGEAAPDGLVRFENLTKLAAYGIAPNNGAVGAVESNESTYGYASPDGSHVFFQSVDQLTDDAPTGGTLKVYNFDVDTDSLQYLPGVTLGGIVTAASDGSSFTFVDGSGSSPDLDLWSAGPGGGTVSQVAQLPGGGFVGPGRMAADNSVLVFQAQAPIAGFNNGGMEQIYRYEIKTSELACISCPPEGVRPSGNAYLSAIDQYGNLDNNPPLGLVVNDSRGVTSNGERIFFDSPDSLVGRDTNGKLDAYEWENGTIFLISSGTSPENSFFLDNSQSGGDMFFSTTDELVAGDNDGAYDVYDARIPRPGDSPPASAAPCAGSACQGPPAVAQLLGVPASEIFNGVENIVDQEVGSKAKGTPKGISRSQKLASALRACHKRRSKSRRATCERQARKHYALTGASAENKSGRGDR